MTNKKKCLKMWQWLSENPQCDKFNFLSYCNDTNQEELIDNTYLCWACVEADNRVVDKSAFAFAGILTSCEVCPITWVTTKSSNDNNYTCASHDSPYRKWLEATSTPYKRQYAQEIVNLITTTWEE